MLPGFNPELLLRLKHASVPEIAYRLRKLLAARRMMAALARGRAAFAVPAVDPGRIAALRMPELRLPELRLPADGDLLQRLLGGEASTLNAGIEDIRRFEDRHRSTFCGKTRIRPGDPDLRAVWEPARLQHAALLLLAEAADGAARQAGKEAVLKWVEVNPFLRGPHYMSAMECGLRIPVFFYCLKTVPELAGEERSAIARATYEHAWWIERNLSLYASLGNHTVCECVGLVFAGAVFRNTEEGREWIETGCRLLGQELTHQVLADGGPAEQSLSYHRFVLDLYWLAADFLEKNNFGDCAAWKERLARGEAFLAAFQGEGGAWPAIGDSDDGYAVAPGAAPWSGETERPTAAVAIFPDSGYTVIRGAGGLVLTFDHGPLGMAPLYNHGHADALSITLSVAGRPLLVDPGTYRYNGVPEWRRYFKGTRAHNTVTVDGEDQAVQETGFIWSRPYRAGLQKRASGNGWTLLQGSHDGYQRLRESVVHERTVYVENGARILVKDSFKGQDGHGFELNFHLHSDAVVAEANGWITIDMAGARAFIRLIEGGNFEIIRGKENPICGWYSPAYGLKAPTTVLTCARQGRPEETVFLTVLSLERPCDINELKNRFRQIEQQAFRS
jgi:hypothetical protein